MKKISILLWMLLCLSPSLTVNAHYGNSHSSGDSMMTYILAVIVAALVIAGFYVAALVRNMNTIRRAPEASDYIVQNSFKLHEQSDRFLYSHTTRVRIQKNNGGRPGGGPGGRPGGGPRR